MNKLLMVFSAACILISHSMVMAGKHADDVDVSMESMTVTAKRYAAEQIETPAYTTVITEKEMERLGGKNAYEVLKRTGGVNFTSHMPFGIHMGDMSSSIGFRGLKNGELVLLDGMPIMDPSYGYYDIDMIPTAFLERIEVVKGAGATLYGSQAMTGAVNLQLKKPGAPQFFGGELTGGSHGSADASVFYRDPRIVIGGYYARADQLTDLRKYYSAKSPYNTSVLQWDRAASLFKFKPWEALTISHMYNFTDSGWSRDYYTNKTKNYEVLETSNRHYLSLAFEREGLKIVPYYTHNNLIKDYGYEADGKPSNTLEKNNSTAGLDAQKLISFGATDFLMGMSYYYERQDEDNEAVSGSSSSGYTISRQIMDHDRHQGALFVTAEHDFGSRFLISGGIRMVGVWETEDDGENYYEPIPQIQALYRMNKNNSIYANIGRAFRVPAFGRMYIDRAQYAPNPDLKPEYGWTYESGWKFSYGDFSGTLAAFFMDYTDKLGTKYMDDLEKYQYHNMDEFQSAGVEWQLKYRFLENFSLHLAGYAADPWEKIKGEKSQAGAKFQLAPGIEYMNEKLSVGINADMYYDRERGLDDYTNIHLNASYALTHQLALKLSVDNLLDDRDQVIYGNLSSTASTKYATYEPGIWVMAGVEFLF